MAAYEEQDEELPLDGPDSYEDSPPRPDLTPEEALKIYEKIRALGGTELNEKLDAAIKTDAGMRQGMWGVAASWNGTELPEHLSEQLTFEFGEGYLYARNLVSLHGEWIELGVLTGYLPDSIILKDFDFSMEGKAKEVGIDFEKLCDDIAELFVGIDKDCGGNRLFVFRDGLEEGRWCDIMRVTGAGSVYGDWGRGRGWRGIPAEGLAGENLKEILNIEDLDNPVIQFTPPDNPENSNSGNE
jgi:hypothetical protein